MRYTYGDFDGDGDLDLLMADPEAAEVRWHRYTEGRFNQSKLVSIAFFDLHFSGRALLPSRSKDAVLI